MIKKCKWCDVEFTPKDCRELYCSDNCKKERQAAANLERMRNKRHKKPDEDGIEEKLKYCREHNISYSEYQKQQTLKEQWKKEE